MAPRKIFPTRRRPKALLRIPNTFPNYVRYRNKNGKRTIQLESDPMIDLATLGRGSSTRNSTSPPVLQSFSEHSRDGARKRRESSPSLSLSHSPSASKGNPTMTNTPNFASILDEAPSEVDRPKPLLLAPTPASSLGPRSTTSPPRKAPCLFSSPSSPSRQSPTLTRKTSTKWEV